MSRRASDYLALAVPSPARLLFGSPADNQDVSQYPFGVPCGRLTRPPTPIAATASARHCR